MLELLGVLLGGGLRLAPVILDFLKGRKEADLEITRLKLEAELEESRGRQRLLEIEAAAKANLQVEQVKADGAVSVAEIEGIASALRDQLKPTGDKWLDRVNVSVRPILTYWWCIGLHTLNKIAIATIAIQENTPLDKWAGLMYGDFDRQVVGSIIGFWFVDRSLRKPQ